MPYLLDTSRQASHNETDDAQAQQREQYAEIGFEHACTGKTLIDAAGFDTWYARGPRHERDLAYAAYLDGARAFFRSSRLPRSDSWATRRLEAEMAGGHIGHMAVTMLLIQAAPGTVGRSRRSTRLFRAHRQHQDREQIAAIVALTLPTVKLQRIIRVVSPWH